MMKARKDTPLSSSLETETLAESGWDSDPLSCELLGR